jgi:hypothetical protein
VQVARLVLVLLIYPSKATLQLLAVSMQLAVAVDEAVEHLLGLEQLAEAAVAELVKIMVMLAILAVIHQLKASQVETVEHQTGQQEVAVEQQPLAVMAHLVQAGLAGRVELAQMRTPLGLVQLAQVQVVITQVVVVVEQIMERLEQAEQVAVAWQEKILLQAQQAQ